MLTVRRFTADEWRTYRELRLAALGESPDAFASTLARESEYTDDLWSSRLGAAVASPRDFPMVAELDGQPVGLSWARFEQGEPSVVALHQVWVAPEGRGRGAGRAMLEAARAWARSAGAASIELWVTCGNSVARGLYERAGFEPVGDPLPLRAQGPLLAQPMRLTLSPRA